MKISSASLSTFNDVNLNFERMANKRVLSNLVFSLLIHRINKIRKILFKNYITKIFRDLIVLKKFILKYYKILIT